MLKTLRTLSAAVLALAAAPALAEGDPTKGERDFGKCKSCHMIADGETIIAKGGKTGPNLFGVIGRVVGSTDFKYGDSIKAVGATGLVWDEALLTAYLADPGAWLKETLADPGAKSKMTFKLKDGADVAAYLAQYPTVVN